MAAPHLTSSLAQPWCGNFGPRVHANGYALFPIPPGQKRANQAGWQRYCSVPPSDAQIARWCKTVPHYSLAIAGGSVVAIDIDAEEVAQVEALKAIVFKHLGSTDLERVGRAPRCVLLYGVSPGVHIATHRLGAVEILGHGAYIVGFGMHPITRAPYRWTSASPAERPRASLPIATSEAVVSLVAALAAETGRARTPAYSASIVPSEARPLTDRPLAARVRPDARWEVDANGCISDGRDAFLAAQIYRAFAAGLESAEAIGDAAFAWFEAAADLARPKRDGSRAWCRADALAKARALLASGKPRPPRRASLAHAEQAGFWTPATRLAFARAVDAAGAAGRLSPATVAVSGLMLAHVEGDGAAFVAVATLARRLSLAPDTVKRARARLLADGYWTAERVRGGRGHLAYYRPVAAVLAGELPLAQPSTPANGDRSVHPKDQGGEITTAPTDPSSSARLSKKDSPSDE